MGGKYASSSSFTRVYVVFEEGMEVGEGQKRGVAAMTV